MHIETLKSDIPLSAGRAAHSNTSFTPDKRAEQEQTGYAELLASDYEELAKLIVDKPDMVPVLEAEFARYREGYRSRKLAQLAAHSRCASWMITGPSNFPSHRNEKRNNTERRRADEMIEFRKRALDAIRKTLCPELRPIMSGDSDATQRLAEKIADASTLQEVMKDCNAAIRKNAKAGEAAQIAALVALGRTESQARELLKPDFCGRIGFADYELTNNNANIRRMKERLASISRNQSTPSTEANGENARLEDCPAENRVRLFFPGKPSAEVRSRLKSSGFRWSPTIGAWQAYRNSSSLQRAQSEAGIAQECAVTG